MLNFQHSLCERAMTGSSEVDRPLSFYVLRFTLRVSYTHASICTEPIPMFLVKSFPWL